MSDPYRMYATMQPATESAASSGKPDTPAQAGVTPAPVAAGFHTPSHPHDLAARMYPKLEQPDPVAQKIADEAKGDEPAAEKLVEQLPDAVAKLRETKKLTYPAHYDVALGFSTKAIITGQAPAEQVFVRNSVAGMAHDAGLDAGDLNTIVNTIRATRDGKAASTEAASDADLTDAQALYSRDPRLGALLTHFNVATNPHVVRILAEAARQERARGRL